MAPRSVATGLGLAGSRLWEAVSAGFLLDDREQAVLAAACRQLDVVAELEAVVAVAGPMAVGSTGQPVVHPAVVEARQGRLAAARLLGQLNLPAEDDVPASEPSRRARQAAQTRWAQRDRRRERAAELGGA